MNLVLPPSCIVCHESLNSQESLAVCPSCWKDLPRWNTEKDTPPQLPESIDSFHAPFLYEDPVKGLVKHMKFKDTPEYVAPLARFVSLPRVNNLLLIPVPMHSKRLRQRQFNQAALIANKIAKSEELDVDVFALKRIKATEQQVGKSASARAKNLSGAFKVDKEKVQGRDVLLVDDVWTTGSTAEACAKCLKRAGVNSVHVVTICYTPK